MLLRPRAGSAWERARMLIRPPAALLRAALFGLVCGMTASAAEQEGRAASSEEEAYAIEWFEPPAGAVVEVGGLAFLPDGRLVVSTRRGQVWIVANVEDADVRRSTWTLFAEGLHEGLGLTVVDGAIVVLERGQISRLVDEDRDGRADRVERIASDWGLSGNYHEFAFGLPRDSAGRFYIALNVGFWDPKWWHGR